MNPGYGSSAVGVLRVEAGSRRDGAEEMEGAEEIVGFEEELERDDEEAVTDPADKRGRSARRCREEIPEWDKRTYAKEIDSRFGRRWWSSGFRFSFGSN